MRFLVTQVAMVH